MTAIEAPTSPSPALDVEQLELQVSGMTCGSCAMRVERTLARVPGVSEARVNYATARASIMIQAGAVDVQGLVAAVRKSGYDAAPAAGLTSIEGSEAREQAGCWCGSRSRCRSQAIAALTYTEPHAQTRATWPRAGGAGAVLVRAAVPALGVGARARAQPPTWTR